MSASPCDDMHAVVCHGAKDCRPARAPGPRAGDVVRLGVAVGGCVRGGALPEPVFLDNPLGSGA